MTKIPEGWIETTLGELSDKIFSGGTPSTQHEEYYGGNIPWIRTQEVNFNYINETEIKITEQGLNNSSAKWIPQNTVIIAMYGNSAGRVAYSNIEATTNQACCNFVGNKKLCDNKFIFFHLMNRYNEILGMANGAAQQNLSVNVLKQLNMKIPPLPEQKAIAVVLSAFDDKIELLRAENQTLEEMGQTLFKEWFGKYKVGDELPDGWKVGKLGEVIEFIIDNRGKTPLTSDKGDYPMVEINAIIGDGMIINISDCKKFVGEELYNTWFRKGHPKRGDVLFSTVGSVGEIAFVFDEIFCIAQNIVGLRSKYGKFMYLLLKSIQGNLKALDISSVQPSIKLPHLLDYDIVIPDEIRIKEFEARVSPIFEKINNNGKQINTLISTRDQLLPKLMSGEVRVEF